MSVRVGAAGILFLLVGGTTAGAQEPPLRVEDHAFESGDTRLQGTLYLPPGPGPHPVLVGAQGSGLVDRSDLYQTEMAQYMAPRGVGFFIFDKRGVGESEGHYPGSFSSSMVIYAMDVLAAVDYVSTLGDVDATRLGLWGMSQAGWVIPIAASVGRDRIAFTVIVSGPTVTIAEENLYSDLTGSSGGGPSGLTDDEIDVRMAEAEPAGLDAAAFIAELEMPGLWIYGALDKSVPWRQGVEDLTAIQRQWKRDFTWRVFEGANHGLRRATTGGSWERPAPTVPVDGYLEFMADWISGRVGVGR